ncbi:MAG: hypothetical protein ACI94Y_004056 [Maribacter sp.]|jgi:hypothetical protein
MNLKKFILIPILFLPLLAIAGYSHKCDMNVLGTIYSYQYNGTECGTSNDYTVSYTIDGKDFEQTVNGECEVDMAVCCQEV